MLITIGLPFFNNRRTLALAIQSIFAQSFTDWELILIDDGSADGSTAIVQDISDTRVQFIKGDRNMGLPTRLNEIASRANGEYLARMDADDAMHPKRLARQVELLRRDNSLDVVSTAAFIIDAADRIYGLGGLSALPARPESALQRGGWIHPTAMGRTEWFRRNPYDPQMKRSQDFEIWCRTYRTSKFALLPEPLLFYREAGTFNLATYLRMKRADEEVFRRYAAEIVGPWGAKSLIVRSRLKGFLYSALVALKAEDLLVRRRSVPVPTDLLDAGIAAMDRIKSTAVPGLDGTPQF